jgi:hypothetical protein
MAGEIFRADQDPRRVAVPIIIIIIITIRHNRISDWTRR